VFEPKTETTRNADLVATDWVMRCEARTLDDIRALGGNDNDDQHRFAAVARLSEINLALYRTFMQPVVRNVMAPALCEWIRATHPLRLQYAMLSDDNPFLEALRPMARLVEDNRQTVDATNPFLVMQEAMSHNIVRALDTWRDLRDNIAEQTFLSFYGSPLVQTLLGIDPADTRHGRRAGKSTLHHDLVDRRIAELKSRMRKGGLREALVRAMLYIGIPRNAVDERGFEAIRRLRAVTDSGPRMTLAEFKQMVREQFFMLLVDQDEAVAGIPSLLPQDIESRQAGFALLRSVLSVSGEITGDSATRLKQIAQLMGIDAAKQETNAAA
jgi:hypothetical protein